jgi:hypothetical protein
LAGRSKDLVEQKMQHYLQVKAVLSQLQNLDPSDLGFYDELQLRGSPQKIALNLAIKISQQEGSEFALTDFDVEGFGHQIARLCSDESRTVYTLQCLLAAFENTLAQP